MAAVKQRGWCEVVCGGARDSRERKENEVTEGVRRRRKMASLKEKGVGGCSLADR